MSAQVTISQLPLALALTGIEVVPVVQNGLTTKATTQDIANLANSGPSGGVTSFNTRTGAVTLLSSDVTSALGYTAGSVTLVGGTGTVNGLTLTGSVTTSGSLTLGGTLSGIANSALTNSSITINGSSVSLGGSITVTATVANALTIGTGLSGTSYNGSSPVTIAIDSTVATLTGSQTLTNKTISGASNTLSSIANSSLTNSSITINGSSVSLGGSVTVTATASSALTIGTGLSGTSYNGSTSVTIANTGVLSISGGTTGLTPSTATTGAITLGGILAVANGGTGTETPSLVEGTNVTITGTWPNQTINSSGGGTAGANAGIAIASNVYSTIYNSTISDSLTVPNTVGGITAGTTAASLKAKNIVQVIDDLLFPTVLPTYTIPTVAAFTASASGYQEIGQTISQALNQTQNKNDAGVYSSLVFKRGGSVISTSSSPTGTSIANIAAQFGYADPNNPNYSYSKSYTDSFTVVSGATSWTAEGTYGAGLQKQNNKGTLAGTPIAAGTLVSTAKSITGIYPYFWGVSNTAPTAASIASEIAAGTANKVLADSSGSVTITFNANGQYVWFAIAATYTVKNQYLGSNSPSNTGSIGADQFILAPVAQNVNSPNGYWSTVSFNVYISKNATTTYTGTPPTGPFSYTFYTV